MAARKNRLQLNLDFINPPETLSVKSGIKIFFKRFASDVYKLNNSIFQGNKKTPWKPPEGIYLTPLFEGGRGDLSFDPAPLNLHPHHFLIGLDDLVAHLHGHTERQVGLAHCQHRLVHVLAAARH